jgi:hypothetical protein
MKYLTVGLVLFLSGCGGAGPVTDTTQDVVPVVMVDEAAALEAIQDIREAQAAFMATQRRYAQFMDELVDALMIPDEPSWADSGYQIRVIGTPAADGYSATVTAPEDASEVRSFFVDDTSVIRWALGTAASTDSSVLEEDGATGEANPD